MLLTIRGPARDTVACWAGVKDSLADANFRSRYRHMETAIYETPLILYHHRDSVPK